MINWTASLYEFRYATEIDFPPPMIDRFEIRDRYPSAKEATILSPSRTTTKRRAIRGKEKKGGKIGSRIRAVSFSPNFIHEAYRINGSIIPIQRILHLHGYWPEGRVVALQLSIFQTLIVHGSAPPPFR